MKQLFWLLLIGFGLSCSNQEKKSTISSGLCNCFAPVDLTLSELTRRLLSELATVQDPVSHFRGELDKLSPEQQLSIREELKMGGEQGAGFRVYSDCIKNLRDKHVDSTASREKKNEIFEQAVEGMRNERDCSAAHGYFRLLLAANRPE